MAENIAKLKAKATLTSIKELDNAISWAVKAHFSVLKSKSIMLLVRGNKGRSYDVFYPKKIRFSLLSDEPLFLYLRLHPQTLVRVKIPSLLRNNFQDRKLLVNIELKLKRLNADAVVPLYLDKQIYGIILLHTKKLKKSFVKDDFEILETIQENVSNALIGAILYKEAIERIVPV